ncbi:heterokaryon incompatibility protein-domain-containing protein [Xylariales sp. PMI_506]|nr:heterokaryon incompatibility protein-domain-containing protein [Xylariales sp. PMI_506]
MSGPTDQCLVCLDLHTTAAVPEYVKANAHRCILCHLLAQICTLHEQTTDGRAGLLMLYQLRGEQGLRIAVVPHETAGHSSAANNVYRVISVSQEIPQLPFDLPIRKIVSPAPSVQEIARYLLNWLSWCAKNHHVCERVQGEQKTDGSKPPARLLQLGSTENPTLRVVDFLDPETKFAALSYCWGKGQQVKLTSTTLGDFRAAIAEDALPQTIKDAIILTRELGIEYLWIDALCIIQDSAEDWQAESGKMANVYGAAYVVISADRGESCDAGFLGSRATPYEVIHLGHENIEGSDNGNINSTGPMYAFIKKGNRVDTGELMHNFVLSGYLSEQQMASACPVYGRGWCLQEQVLATRLAHFSDCEVVMECAEGIGCECGALSAGGDDGAATLVPYNPPELLSEPRKPQWHQTRMGRDTRVMLDAWWACVEQYSVRQLTVDTDRLPAMSGIAQSLSACDLGDYCAGLWQEDLPSGLLWGIKRGFNANTHRPTKYTAPSWSWASILGPVLRPDKPSPLSALREASNSLGNAALVGHRAEMVGFKANYDSSNPFGSLTGGSLTLKATVIGLQVQSISDQGKWHDYLELYGGSNDRISGTKALVPHYPHHNCSEIDLFPSRESQELNLYFETLEVYGVLIDYAGPAQGSVEAHAFAALLIAASRRLDGAYERIGRVNMWIDGGWKPQALEHRDILLV